MNGGDSGRAGSAGRDVESDDVESVDVKICGIRRLEDAQLAVRLGAWAIGFIFHPPSPRSIEPEAARRVVEGIAAGILTVGVFVDRPVDEVNRVVREVGLGAVQLHGSESPAACRAVEAGVVIKAFRVGEAFDPDSVLAYEGVRILLDTYRRGAPGGTGETFDWSVARRVGERVPVILAGGLKPENVAAAIRAARPAAVDVSSGIEISPGVKDPEALWRVFAEVESAGG